MKGIIIQGSSRKDGNTATVIEPIERALGWDVLHLCQYDIAQYDYHHLNQSDSFLKLFEKSVTYDVILFATPVYWYSMSGYTKVFLDRITDCLKIKKELGRKLRGKKMASLSCGSEETLNEGFHVPFELSAQYLGMTYLGNVHTWIEDEEWEEPAQKRIFDFITDLTQG